MTQKTYEDFEARGEQLYQSGQYDAFIDLYKREMNSFPDHLPEMIHDLAFVYLARGDKINALAFLSAGLERGYFFGLPEWGTFVQQLGNEPEFKKLREYNQNLQSIARQSARPQWTIKTPDGYDPFGSYPLFISLHGYGENIDTMKRFWHAPMLQEKFIHAYLQSSQVVDLKNFSWEDIPIARQEIVQMVSEITDHHAVDLDQIYIGGFSQGGTMSIDLAMTQALPVRGFVALCPNKPDSVQPELLENLRDIGLKAVILTGEKDGMLDRQKEMAQDFKECPIALSL